MVLPRLGRSRSYHTLGWRLASIACALGPFYALLRDVPPVAAPLAASRPRSPIPPPPHPHPPAAGAPAPPAAPTPGRPPARARPGRIQPAPLPVRGSGGEPVHLGGRHPGRSQHLLRGRRLRRHLEDHRRRGPLVARVRQLWGPVHRLPGPRRPPLPP